RAELLFDCAQRESQWDTTAINRDDGAPGSDSYGLLQVKLTTARWILSKPQLTAEELLRVGMNIEAGTRYLKYCLEEFGGDEVLAVAAYRSGPTAVKEALKELATR
ncbi:MAG: transglycosylase SLT domain-containing protein, partial [Bacteroidota bacterium]